MTFLAALHHDRIKASWLIDGPINGKAFLLYIEKVLVPTLRLGDIVIMDNLGSHKANAVRRAIRAVGARLFYLPKYSPDEGATDMTGRADPGAQERSARSREHSRSYASTVANGTSVSAMAPACELRGPTMEYLEKVRSLSRPPSSI